MSRPQRLPGIAFVAEPPQPEAVLPRMDIAGFVGFAATGPLDRPVVVEDEARFQEIFGPDLPLAWDSASGGFTHSLLGPSVRAFFRNGGRRCWVVRIAGRAERAPVTQYLPLPGVVHADGWGFSPALVRARSPGSWGDGLQVRCQLKTESLTLRKLEPTSLGVSQEFVGRLEVGDLVRLWYPDGVVEFAPVVSMENRERTLWLDTPERYRFESVHGDIAVEALRLPDAQGRGITVDATVELFSPESGASFEVLVDLSRATALPQTGMLLPARVSGAWDHVLRVDDVTLEPSTDSPSSDSVRLVIGASWREADARPHGDKPLLVQSLSLGLKVNHTAEDHSWRLDELGLYGGHPRAWSRLPTDEQLFPLPDVAGTVQENGLAGQVDYPRFPLAGTDQSGAILPLGLGADPSPLSTVLGDTARETALVRDGLTAIDEHIYFDEALAPARVAQSLPASAYHRRYQQKLPLQGLHSLFFLDEVTLISVPDAVQLGWAWDDPVAKPTHFTAPHLSAVPFMNGDRQGFSWSLVPEAATYRWQVAFDPLFEMLDMQSETKDTGFAVPPQQPCLGWRWVRVRAEDGARVGPWSNSLMFSVPASDFEAVRFVPPGGPELFAIESLGGDCHRLAWAGPEGATEYLLEEAGLPDFSDSHELVCSGDTVFELLRPVHKVTYFRVRAANPATPWSETRWLLPDPEGSWRMVAATPEAPAWLPVVHEAMLHMSAARADLLATLTLPRHLRAGEVIEYLERLTGRFPNTQDCTLSYGALYHPWILSSLRGRGDDWTAPDGLAVGLQAAGALGQGAWVAPANVPFTEVLGLIPEMDDSDWARLHAAQVNLVRRHPRGFLCLSASTLSRQQQLRPIGVRRLLILLRRLALREGQALVFEPNDESLRRRVKRLFDSLLGQLYERGAFAGRRPEEAYQVVIDDSVNPSTSIDRGRLLVELRVAPSQPLEFLTVRLLQYGNGELRLEGS